MMCTYEDSIKAIAWLNDRPAYKNMLDYAIANSGKEGHNQYGVPEHAQFGKRHDAHYWTAIGSINLIRNFY